jgi:hypothetical protein
MDKMREGRHVDARAALRCSIRENGFVICFLIMLFFSSIYERFGHF